MSENEATLKAISKGYCEYHAEFEKKHNDIIEVQEDKYMAIWEITKKELYEIVITSQKVVIEHLNDLKGMVTNFISLTAGNIKRHENEIERLNKRMLSMEKRYHILKNEIKTNGTNTKE
jgi:hypothetical protein